MYNKVQAQVIYSSLKHLQYTDQGICTNYIDILHFSFYVTVSYMFITKV